MNPVESLAGAALRANNTVVRRVDRLRDNPRPLGALHWHLHLQTRWPEIRGEWDAFRGAGGRLPRIEDLLGEGQGVTEVWAAGLLVTGGRPVGPHVERFPATIAALRGLPGLRSALWSVLAPGAVLPPHRGPNAGVLRYHLGVVCPVGALLTVAGREVPYVEGEGILFDDTAEHGAVNSAAVERVTLMCELDRPLPQPWREVNRAVQRLRALDDRYRSASRRADAWDRAMNARIR